MKAVQWVAGCALALGLCMAVTVTRAEDKKPTGDKPAAGHPEMSPEAMKEMEAWMKAGTPGPEHEKLMKMAGNWKAEVKMWEGPGEPTVSQGTAEFKPILGGRYLEETFKGEAHGMPFEGRGLCGYDNIKKKYITGWIDSMSTGVMMMEGTWDEAQKAVVSHGEMTDPMGVTWKMRIVGRDDGDDKHSFEMHKTGPDGKETKCMEISYTRA